MGSRSDWETMRHAAETLDELGIAVRAARRLGAPDARPPLRVRGVGGGARAESADRRRRWRCAPARDGGVEDDVARARGAGRVEGALRHGFAALDRPDAGRDPGRDARDRPRGRGQCGAPRRRDPGRLGHRRSPSGCGASARPRRRPCSTAPIRRPERSWESDAPMTLVACIGGGQLGRMLGLAGLPLGLSFRFLDPAPDACAREVGELVVAPYDDAAALDRLADGAAVVTYEFENVPVEAAARIGAVARPAGARAGPGPAAREGALPLARDPDSALRRRSATRGSRRSSSRVGWATTARASVCSSGTGRSGTTSWPRSSSPSTASSRSSACGARDGETRFWPVAENVHRDGILRVTRAPARRSAAGRGGPDLHALIDALGYVGVLAVELFDVGGRAVRQRVRAARPQHGPLDDRRRRDEPVREPPAGDPRPAARADGALARRR